MKRVCFLCGYTIVADTQLIHIFLICRHERSWIWILCSRYLYLLSSWNINKWYDCLIDSYTCSMILNICISSYSKTIPFHLYRIKLNLHLPTSSIPIDPYTHTKIRFISIHTHPHPNSFLIRFNLPTLSYSLQPSHPPKCFPHFIPRLIVV